MAATSKALPRPGLLAHRESLNLSFPDLVSRLADAIGRKLIAYVAGVKDVRAVDRWIGGSAAVWRRRVASAADLPGRAHTARS